ncbi:endo-1,4-beta-xylanase [Candidatus Saccharibacteria bacterium]|nr:endo-1,4-beta-xylanase [Candidatus Saccharibacteria bacterium]
MVKKKKPVQQKQMLKVYVIVAALLIVSAIAAKSRQISTPGLPSPSLKDLAARHEIALGNFAILNHLDDKPYTDILSSQFNFALADNTPNWYFTDGGLHPSRTTYNYKQMDEVMAFAEAHGMPVEAHHYVWGEAKWLPDWLKDGNFTKPELMDILRDHIMNVGSNYRGRIAQWTVVNEAFTRAQHLYDLNDWWADNTKGLDYIDQSFIWARQADPSSKLILNDFNNESINDTSNAMYDYLKGALARGVPIDGIGMQMHLDGGHPPFKDEVISNMKRFADLGLEVYVTEFDVNMNDVKADAKDKNRIQENIYYEMMRACIESKVCHSFAFLGITDDETWYKHIGLKDPRPLMFDERYRPKPAFYGVRTALEQE